MTKGLHRNSLRKGEPNRTIVEDIIEQIKAYVESRKNTAETIRERDICIDIIEVIDYIQEKSEKPTLQEQPVKDFPTTDEEMQHFLATHKPVQVPDKYKTADWIFKEQPVCDGLEEEIERYIRFNGNGYSVVLDDDDLRKLARHFAQWQREKDNKEADKALTTSIKLQEGWYAKGIADGEKSMREQMLREAVEGMVVGSVGTKQWVESNYLDNNIGKHGDKVRIIIVKEEGE